MDKNRMFFDDWERDFDKNAKRITGGVLAVWAASLLVCLAFWATVIWAIVKVVTHYT